MNLIARLKRAWSRHDEKLQEEGIETQAAAGGDDLSLTPGRDRQIEEAAERRAHEEEA